MRLSDSPRPARTWWGTVPGQLALVAMLIGGLIIAGALFGWWGPRA